MGETPISYNLPLEGASGKLLDYNEKSLASK
jgi:hypothetical protein